MRDNKLFDNTRKHCILLDTNTMITMIQFLALKMMKSPKRGTDIQKKLYESGIIKGYRSGYCCLYKLADKNLCKLNSNNQWEITPEGQELLTIIETL